jgi:hypothetical protein
MGVKAVAARLAAWLRGWQRTLLSGAPEGMAQVATEYRKERYVDDAQQVQELLEPYRQLLQGGSYTGPDYQVPADGIGKLYHRDYRIVFQTTHAPETIVAAVIGDLNRFTDANLAGFHKIRGSDNACRVGDRFDIIITGPWNGPVEVVDSRPDRFSFVTLKTHLEAGFITFQVDKTGEREAAFRIRSWASCGGPLVWFTYVFLGISKRMQTKMWRYFCLRVAQEFGDACSGLVVTTYRMPKPRD